MITSFIAILLIVASILLLTKQIKSCSIFLVITLACFVGIGNGLVPAILLDHLQTPFVEQTAFQWKNKNAIVLLGAGAIQVPINKAIHPTIMAFSRMHEAAHRYFECIKSDHQCTIIISGGDPLRAGRSEAAVYRDALINLGIKDADIELEPNSMNTYQNAEYTSEILKKNQFDQVILVTSGIHLTRALLYFSHFGVNAKPAFADYLAPQFSLIPLGYNFAITDFAMHEYIGIVRFYIYNVLGWNERRLSS